MKTKQHKKTKVNVITLGCSKNLVDSEVMMNQLNAGGIETEHDQNESDANVTIINTCGFIDKAKEESINTILDYADLRAKGEIDKLYVTGCLSERYKGDLSKEIPEVDAYFGTMELPSLLQEFNIDYKHELVGERRLTTPKHYAYLKISEGCNRTCAFCAIPLMRGKHRSKPIEDVVAEATALVEKGVQEVILIAQELTFYGLDIYKKRKLDELLEKLAAISGLRWIRLHYAYPSQFPKEVLPVMKANANICNYLDIPLQHANDDVLKAMRRNIDQRTTKELIQSIREQVPGIAIRTTMLVGFPGETDEQFEDLVQFVQEMKFERLGVFTYSHEEGTKAQNLEDDVPEEVKQERANRLMEVQSEIAISHNENLIGRTLTCHIDRLEGDHFVGRTEYDSPEVDNEVLIDAKEHYLRVGGFVDLKITHVEGYDLYGEPIEK